MLCALPILAKWILIGRWKPQQIRIWSLAYVRFWVVKTLIRSNPLVLFIGSPLYMLYLRALGAKIGRGVAIFSRTRAGVHRPAHHRRRHGHPQRLVLQLLPGPRRPDPDRPGHHRQGCRSSARPTVLDIDTSMGDGAQLGHASSLHTGQVVPDGRALARVTGTADRVDYRTVDPARCGACGEVAYSAWQLLTLLLVYVPLAIGGVGILLRRGSAAAARCWTRAPRPSRPGRSIVDALVASSVLFFGSVLVGLVFVVTVPRLLKPAISARTRSIRCTASTTGSTGRSRA